MRNAAVLALVCAACSRPTAAAPATPAPPSLDDLTRALWTEAKVTPAPIADDGAFLRRVSLDLTGKLPARHAVAAYLADTDPDKKRKLVDRLLVGEDYGEHWADIYLAVLGGRSLHPPTLKGSIHRWLVSAFANNRRWDEMTREMLTATGKVSENGALGFLVAYGAKGGSPEAVAGATARVFLGTQAQCAQCHDHPYDPVPLLSARMKRLARVRSLTAKEGNHQRARHLMHTGYPPRGEWTTRRSGRWSRRNARRRTCPATSRSAARARTRVSFRRRCRRSS